MKLIIGFLLLAVAPLVQAQVMRERAQVLAGPGKPGTPAMNDVQLRAAALTNFSARCATDYNWKTFTNQIAKTKASIRNIQQRLSTARTRHTLAFNSKQTKAWRSQEVEDVQAELKAANIQLAGQELQKLEREEQLKRVYHFR